MIFLPHYLAAFADVFPELAHLQPWEVVRQLPEVISGRIPALGAEYGVNKGIAIHKTAKVEAGAVLKSPCIIGEGAFVGAHAYLRGGVYVGAHSVIGPGCELKTCILLDHSALAHFNFAGDSLIGSGVNLEAGAVIANHYNERTDKRIWVQTPEGLTDTGVEKFGAMVGDGVKIGANAVLSPGTLLAPGAIVGRLELVKQVQDHP